MAKISNQWKLELDKETGRYKLVKRPPRALVDKIKQRKSKNVRYIKRNLEDD